MQTLKFIPSLVSPQMASEPNGFDSRHQFQTVSKCWLNYTRVGGTEMDLFLVSTFQDTSSGKEVLAHTIQSKMTSTTTAQILHFCRQILQEPQRSPFLRKRKTETNHRSNSSRYSGSQMKTYNTRFDNQCVLKSISSKNL